MPLRVPARRWSAPAGGYRGPNGGAHVRCAGRRHIGLAPGTKDPGNGRATKSRLDRVIRRKLLAIGLVAAGLIAGCGGVPADVAFPRGSAQRNLTYCNSQQLDLYIPRSASTQPLPIAMYVHGGGMTAGDKSDLSPVFLDALASAGYAVVSVNYRLAPASHFPAQLQDVKCAIRYLRYKATLYGLNGREIFAFGTSVGGQLVAGRSHRTSFEIRCGGVSERTEQPCWRR